MVREDNQVLNKTTTYSYDKGGNITSRVEYPYTTGTLGTATDTCSYGYDTTWKDLMTSFDGYPIVHDNIGNPTSYKGYTYTWEMGRQLAGISGNGIAISYKYNDSGIRTQKIVKNTTTNVSVTTNYQLSGDKVIYEENSIDKIYYAYDNIGKLVSLNLNGVEYYYIRNAQGDVIGLFDTAGTQVASYVYDSWAKLISIKNHNGTDITNSTSYVGNKNPYRYRGYRYDNETWLYYVQSRYYNPVWGRFLNADAIVGQPGTLLSANMFAYCVNNPILLKDSNGFRPMEGCTPREEDIAANERLREQLASQYERYYEHQNSIVHKVMDPVAEGLGSQIGGAITGGVDASIGKSIDKAWTGKALFPPKTFRTAVHAGSGGLFLANKLAKGSGVISAGAFLVGLWDNYSHYENWGYRTAVDVGVVAVGIVGGAALSFFGVPATGILVGGLIIGGIASAVGDLAKDNFFGKKK